MPQGSFYSAQSLWTSLRHVVEYAWNGRLSAFAMAMIFGPFSAKNFKNQSNRLKNENDQLKTNQSKTTNWMSKKLLKVLLMVTNVFFATKTKDSKMDWENLFISVCILEQSFFIADSRDNKVTVFTRWNHQSNRNLQQVVHKQCYLRRLNHKYWFGKQVILY